MNFWYLAKGKYVIERLFFINYVILVSLLAYTVCLVIGRRRISEFHIRRHVKWYIGEY